MGGLSSKRTEMGGGGRKLTQKAFSDDNLVHRNRIWRSPGTLRFIGISRSLKPTSTEVLSRDKVSTTLQAFKSRTFGPKSSSSSSTFLQHSASLAPLNGLVRSSTLNDNNNANNIGNNNGTNKVNVLTRRLQPLASATSASRSADDDGVRSNAPVTDNAPRTSADVSDEDRQLRRIVEKTAAFLAYEIEPLLMAEYLQRRGRKRRSSVRGKNGDSWGPGTGAGAEMGTERVAGNSSRTSSGTGIPEGSGATLSNREMCQFLSRILGDTTSEEYRLFSSLLHRVDSDKHTAEFLDSLTLLFKLVAPPSLSQAGEGNPPNEGLSKDGLKSLLRPCTPDLSCTCGCFTTGNAVGPDDVTDDESDGRYFDIEIQYVDEETRQTQLYNDVIVHKRRKQRRSHQQLLTTVPPINDEGDDVTDSSAVRRGGSSAGEKDMSARDGAGEQHRVTPLRDSSDRYVPVMSVRLYDQCLCDRRMRRLESMMDENSSVRDLRLVRARFDVPGLVRLGRLVERIRGLHELDVRFCSVGNDGAMFLASALRYNGSLRVLDLTGNHLNAHGCRMLTRGLARNRTLTDLDVGSNRIGDVGCCALADCLTTSGSSLRSLRVRNCSAGERGVTAIFTALRRNSKLSRLDVSGNAVSDAALCTLADVLVFNRTLRQLVADNCGISHIGCGALARPLRANSVLRHLAMNDNPAVGDTGLELLADGLKYNRVLEELRFDACNIGNRGLLHLLNTMQTNGGGCLKSIGLCRNNIGLRSPSRNSRTAGRTGGSCSRADSRSRRSDIFSGRDVSPVHSFKMAGNGDAMSWKTRASGLGELCVPELHSPSRASDFSDDVSTFEDCDDVIYEKLMTVMSGNSQLRISLLGNRIDDASRSMFTILPAYRIDVFNSM